MILLPAVVVLLQTAGAVDKIVDELFSSTPARLVFIVMIVAIASIPVMLWFFLRILDRSLKSSATILEKALAASASDREKLLTVITGLQAYVNTAQGENTENYLMVKTFLEQYETKFTAASDAIKANQESSNAHVRAIGDLLIQTTTQHAETRRNIQLNIKTELMNALEYILDQRRIDLFEEFQTPADDDCRYQIKMIRAAQTPLNLDNGDGSRDILLYKAPIFRDHNEAGRLRGSGEIVKIITDTVFPGWVYIHQMYGKVNNLEDSRVKGYARFQSIVIIDLPDAPVIHKESQDV